MICHMHVSKLKGKESYNNNKYLLENQHMMSFTCIIFFILASLCNLPVEVQRGQVAYGRACMAHRWQN